MRSTYISRIAECYQKRDNDFDLAMGALIGPLKSLSPESNPVRKRDVDPSKMLVVDDELRILQAYRRIFSRHGYDILTTSTAIEAKDILVREPVNLLFLDINMTEIDGTLLFDVTRTFHPEVRIVVSSVYPVEEQRERVRGADAYFDKADGQDALLQTVARLTRNHDSLGF